ncbi:Ras GTPase activating protein [Martiniozyma asiatica (nom. inval.)]|nr:Ras GTPase activating protein [Martiniozyma asiatica]
MNTRRIEISYPDNIFVKNIFIRTIFERLDNILPYKTGFSINQVQLDPIYIHVRSQLSKLLGNQTYLLDLTTACQNILINILKDGKYSIDKMGQHNVVSIYIMVNLLSTYLEKIKFEDFLNHSNGKAFKLAGLKTTPETFNANNHIVESSTPLPTEFIIGLLELLCAIKTDVECIEALKNNLTDQIYLDPSHSSHSLLEDLRNTNLIYNNLINAENSKLIKEIDLKVDGILYYLAANNPTAYFRFVQMSFKRINVEKIYIPKLFLLKYVYLSHSTFNKYINLVKNLHHITKRSSQHAMILFFFAGSVLNWALYRTDDYLKAADDEYVAANTEILFDIIYKQFDHKNYTKAYYRILSCLMLFQIKQIRKFVTEKSHKSSSQVLKRSMGKINSSFGSSNNKHKFLVDFVQVIHKCPEAATSLTKFMLVGCSIETINSSHPLATFVHVYFEQFCVELQMNKPEYTIPSHFFNNLNTNSTNISSTSNPILTSTSTSTSASASTSTSISNSNTNTLSNSSVSGTSSSIQKSQFGSTVPFKCDPVKELMVIIDKLRISLFAILTMINPKELIDRMVAIFKSLESSLSMLAELSGGLKLLVTIPTLSFKLIPYLQDASPVLTRYMRITATNLLKYGWKPDFADENAFGKKFDEDRKYSPSSSSNSVTPDSSTTILNTTGIWPGPANSISLAPTQSLNGSIKSVSGVTSKVKNVLKSPIERTQTITNDTSQVAANLNLKLVSSSLPMNNNRMLKDDSQSVKSVESSDEDPEFIKLMDKTFTGKTITVPRLSLKNNSFDDKEKLFQHKIMINLMDTYSIYTSLCYLDIGEYPNVNFPKFEDHFKKFIDPIASLLIATDKDLVKAVQNFLLSFCYSVSNEKPLRVFVAYIATSILVDAAARVGLTPYIVDADRDAVIKLMMEMLELRAEYSDLVTMYEYRYMIESVHASKSCGRIIRNFERCIFLGLFSDNLDTVRTSRRLLTFWIFVVTNKHHHPYCFDKTNLPLAKIILSDKVPVGSMAIKKKLRDHLCQLKEPTEVLLDVWSLMYEKLAIAHDYDDIPSISSDEAMNHYLLHHLPSEDMAVYGEYMASLGGIIMSPSFASDMRQPFLQKRLEKFLNYKMTNLFSKNSKQREHCREILCVSLHPYLCGLIINLATKFLPKFEENLKMKEYNICELFFSVLRSLCLVKTTALFQYVPQLWKINFAVLKLMNKDDNDAAFLRLKLKFCKMEVLFLSNLDKLALNGNIGIKNAFAREAADYLETSCNYDKDIPKEKSLFSWSDSKMSNKLQELKQSELNDLHLDIKAESSIMLKLIFYKLPLDALSQTENVESAASVVFSNYFNLFVRLLERLNSMKEDEDKNMINKHRSSNIIRDIIQSLVNLLTANSAIGLKYALPLGYHNDSLIRVSFIDVFSNIVEELYHQFGKKDTSSNYNVLLNALFNNEYLLIAASDICPKRYIEQFANALLEASPDEGTTLKAIMSLITCDINKTNDKNEIMRSNTVGTRLVALYSKSITLEYLNNLLKPVMEELIKNEEYFEIEKIKDMTEDDQKRNCDLFFKYFELITDRICNSIEEIPLGVKIISKIIFDITAKKIPGFKYAALSSYLFLRLFNPAIVAPERLDIIDCTDHRFKRSLMQLARFLQMVVNDTNIRFPLVENFTGKVDITRKKLKVFMKEVVNIDINAEIDNFIGEKQIKLATKDVKSTSKLFFHSFFYDNWLEIRAVISDNTQTPNYTLEKKQQLIRDIDKSLSALGLPERSKSYEIPETIKDDKSEQGVMLYDFLSQMSAIDVDRKFVETWITKDGMPLIVINTLKINENISADKLSYVIIQTCIKYWDVPYCVMWDLTSFSDTSLYKQITEIICPLMLASAASNLKRIYMYNMSPRFFDVYKTFDHHHEDLVNVEYVFLSTDDDTKAINKAGLISYTNSASSDARVSFRDVSLYQLSVKRFVPVKLRVGNKFVQIFSAMPQRVKIGNRMHLIHLVDYYRIKDLEDITASSYTGVSHEISMIDTKNSFRIILTSTKNIEIMRTLYFSRARLNNNVYITEDENKLNLNPQYAVGQLLNISFRGLLANADSIRNASFSLISAMCNCVGLKPGRPIDYVEGVIFSIGNFDFITSLSAKLSENHQALTFPFLYGFFNAFDSATTEERDTIIMYASPWIKNIYDHVFLTDNFRGPGRARELIRNLVRISRSSENQQMFALFIWPQISMQDELIEYTIDEIVAASIDHEAEGHAWDDITRYWPLKPTIQICSSLLKRLKDKSYDTLIDESEIESHTRWVETTVLVRILSYLIFDSLLFVEKYISDIFYIVTIYMDYGPLDLRLSLLKLLNRAFHSYISKNLLSNEQRELIHKNIELMNSARFRLLFGLTREDNSQVPMRKLLSSDMVNISNSVAVLCEIFTRFIKKFSDPEEYELQMIKWNTYATKIAFNKNALLQDRAILILGSLTKQGTSDVLVCKFLKLIQENCHLYTFASTEDIPKYLKLVICTMHAFGKAIEGINEDSIFHPLVFWLSFAIMFVDNGSFYQFGNRYCRASLLKIRKFLNGTNINFVDYLYQKRTELEPLLYEYENLFNVKDNYENFDALMQGLIAKGLESPLAANEAIETAKLLSKMRYEQSKKFANVTFDNYTGYVFMLYMTSTSNDEFQEILDSCGMGQIETVLGVGGHLIPKIFLEGFKNRSLNYHAACVSILNYFKSPKLDEHASSKSIEVFYEVFKENSKILVDGFPQVRYLLERFLAESSSHNLLDAVMTMVTKVMSVPEFEGDCENDSEKIIASKNLQGLVDLRFTTNDPFTEAAYIVPRDVKKRRFFYLDQIMKKIIEIYMDQI